SSLYHKLSLEHPSSEGLEGSFEVCAERLVSEWNRHLSEWLSIHRAAGRQRAEYQCCHAAAQFGARAGSASLQSRSKSLVQYTGIPVLGLTIWRCGSKHITTAGNKDLGYRTVQRVPCDGGPAFSVSRRSLQPFQHPAIQRAERSTGRSGVRPDCFDVAEQPALAGGSEISVLID